MGVIFDYSGDLSNQVSEWWRSKKKKMGKKKSSQFIVNAIKIIHCKNNCRYPENNGLIEEILNEKGQEWEQEGGHKFN